MTGTLPKSLSSCISLTYLNIGENQLIGLLPKSYAHLINIEHVLLYNNQLCGKIPDQYRQWTKLKVFDVDNNHLRGTIDMILSIDTVYYFYFQHNQFDGLLPPIESVNEDEMSECISYGNYFKNCHTFPNNTNNYPLHECIDTKTCQYDACQSNPCPTINQCINLPSLKTYLCDCHIDQSCSSDLLNYVIIALIILLLLIFNYYIIYYPSTTK